jgi:hypothetical protein
MTTKIYPQSIQNLLSAVQEYDGSDLWSDVLNHSTSVREQELTATLCSSETVDFIVLDGEDAFLFVSDDQTGVWTVQHVGKPIYYVEQEMLGGDDIDLDEFIAELKHELPGVEIEKGSALKNLRSDFVAEFRNEIDRAFQCALVNLA